jgi:hypothetical protein
MTIQYDMYKIGLSRIVSNILAAETYGQEIQSIAHKSFEISEQLFYCVCMWANTGHEYCVDCMLPTTCFTDTVFARV